MTLARKIFFYLFVAIYLIFCPLTILYALGYLFRPGAQRGIVRTGLVYLSTAPPGASVYVGHRRFTGRTPTILRDLLPGDYDITLALKGRKLWSQRVPVEAEKATVLERVLLPPEAWRREVLWPKAFTQLVPLEGTRYLLLAAGPLLEDEFVYDWKERRGRPLSAEPWMRGARVLARFTVPKSEDLLFKVRAKEQDRYLWVKLGERETAVRDVSNLFPSSPQRVGWDPEARENLFALRGGALDRLSLNARAVFPKFLSQVRGFGFFDKRLYVLQSGPLFLSSDLEARKLELLLDDLVLSRSLFGEEGAFDIFVFSKDLILFRGPRGELKGNRLPYHYVEDGVSGVAYDPHEERVLVWKKDRLGVLDLEREASPEDVFERGPKLDWVFKRGQTIGQAFWVYEGSHVLFRDQDRTVLAEVETYGKPHLYPLAEVREGSDISYIEESGQVHYLDPATGYLSAIELLPRRDLLLLPFPERKEEKKESRIQEVA